MSKAGTKVDTIVIGLVLTAAVAVVLFQMVPVIGETTAGIVTFGATSQWNESVNTALPSAPDLWETLGGVATLALVLTGIGVGIKGLMKMARA